MNTIPKLINTIQNLGYKVFLEDDKIKLKFIGKDDPPKEALTIINEIKGNKAVVIEYLKNISRMDDIFRNAANEISKAFTENAIHYTQKMFPKTYEKGITAENKINSLWDEGKDIKAFQEAVKEWQQIQIRVIKLFNAKKDIDDNEGKEYNPSNGKPGPSQGLGKEVV